MPPRLPALLIFSLISILLQTDSRQCNGLSKRIGCGLPRLNSDLLNILDGHLVGRPVVELGRARALMRGDPLSALERAVIEQIRRDAGGPEGVAIGFAEPDGLHAPLDHPEDIHVIAEKLTEERAREYADAKGISVERVMKQLPHVSKRTAWDDVTAEWEELRRKTEMQRADLMALENARWDQVFSKALSLFANGRVPAGRLAIATMGRRCRIVAGTRPAASRCRGTRRTLRTRGRVRE